MKQEHKRQCNGLVQWRMFVVAGRGHGPPKILIFFLYFRYFKIFYIIDIR